MASGGMDIETGIRCRANERKGREGDYSALKGTNVHAGATPALRPSGRGGTLAIRAYNAGLIDKGPDAKGEVIVRAERDKNWRSGGYWGCSADEGLNRLCPEPKKKGDAYA